MPPDSAIARDVQPHWYWTTEHELLSYIAELLDQGNKQYLSAHVKKGTRIPKVIRIPRPTDKQPAAKRKATASEIRELMGGAPLITPKQ